MTKINKSILLCIVFSAFGAAGALVATNPPRLSFLSASEPAPSLDAASDAGAVILAQRTPSARDVPPPPGRAAPGFDAPTKRSPALDFAAPNRPTDRAVDRAAADRAALDAELTPEERVNISVYEKVNRSVVNITTKTVRGDSFFMLEVPSEGSGSGSVLDKRGHVLTNYHVIEDAQEIRVTLFNGHPYPAKLVGKDPSTDLAVLRIDAPADTLIPVALGDSSHLRVGQRVLAIGNPFGLERTLTTGIISSLNRSLPSRNHRTISSIIQIDAAINPGNSGGPLLDGRGRLIGMNTAIASKTGQSAGVGFAIPVGTIARIVPQLIQAGRVVRPTIGVTRVLETEYGLVVVALANDGPADRAGLKGFRVVRERIQRGPFIEERQRIDRTNADVIVAIDAAKVTTAEQFLSLIEAKKPGDEVDLSLIRENARVNVKVRLAAGE